MKLGKLRHAALASVMSLALVGAWMPAAQAEEVAPSEPEASAVVEETEEPLASPSEDVTSEPAETTTPEAVEEATPEAAESVAPEAEKTATVQTRTLARTASAQSCTLTAASAPVKSHGSTTNVWGNMSGCRAGSLQLQRLVNGRWTTVGQRNVSGSGSYVIGATSATAAAGTHTLRVALNGATSPRTQLVRLGAPTAATAGRKYVGEVTNVWGLFPGAGNRRVWTEVRLPNGTWSRSQIRTTNVNGAYTIPLTYGAGAPGTYSYRVAASYPDGSIVRTSTVTITRVAKPSPPSISTAGTAHIGATANAWGTVPNGTNVRVWTEVYRNGEWASSQVRNTDSKGFYAIPLTYGANTVGTYRYRVAAAVNGTVVRSKEVSFKRTNPLPAGVDRRCLTGRTLCASKTTNKMHWIIDGRLIETVDVRYGRPGLETREGAFQVFRKSRDHVSSIYGTAMPFSMFFSGGQAVHYSADFARRGYVGGSAGCINVRDYNTLERIYDQVRIGDKVVVYW